MIYMAKYKDIPLYVNLAGRFYMDKTPATRFTKEQLEELAATGQTRWCVPKLWITILLQREEKSQLSAILSEQGR
jgi:hypothetical protein